MHVRSLEARLTDALEVVETLLHTARESVSVISTVSRSNRTRPDDGYANPRSI
jgi:hypothetical protein